MSGPNGVVQGAGLVLMAALGATAGLSVASWWWPGPTPPAPSCELPGDASAPRSTLPERGRWGLSMVEAAPLGSAPSGPEAMSIAGSSGPAVGTSATPAPIAAPRQSAEPMEIEFGGMLRLSAEGKALRAEESAEAVVYWRPRQPVTLVAPEEPLVVTTRRKAFLPRSLPIVVGSQVRFPNEDAILHNAFSTSAGNAFDTGLYGAGEGDTVRFEQAGLVRVYCNVHQSMVAHILVLDTPYFTRPDRSGRFTMKLPAGPGELFVWHERATLWRKPLSIEAFSTVDVQLDLSRRRVPAHLNKFGKPYRSGGSEYR